MRRPRGLVRGAGFLPVGWLVLKEVAAQVKPVPGRRTRKARPRFWRQVDESPRRASGGSRAACSAKRVGVVRGGRLRPAVGGRTAPGAGDSKSGLFSWLSVVSPNRVAPHRSGGVCLPAHFRPQRGVHGLRLSRNFVNRGRVGKIDWRGPALSPRWVVLPGRVHGRPAEGSLPSGRGRRRPKGQEVRLAGFRVPRSFPAGES